MNNSNISKDPRIQTIDIRKISGTDYPELDEALKSGKKMSISDVEDIISPTDDYAPGKKVTMPIEVKKNSDGTYSLQAGNHRLAQKLINGETTIEANVLGDRSGKSLDKIYQLSKNTAGEAKKLNPADFKTSDEWVKANGKTLYHGSDVKINTFDSKKGSQGVIWFTDNSEAIKRGESGAVSSKVINERIATGKKFAGWDEYEKLTLGQIEQMGFDGIKLPTTLSDGTKYNDYVLFGNKTLKTKSQLISEWNKAHGKK